MHQNVKLSLGASFYHWRPFCIGYPTEINLFCDDTMKNSSTVQKVSSEGNDAIEGIYPSAFDDLMMPGLKPGR